MNFGHFSLEKPMDHPSEKCPIEVDFIHFNLKRKIWEDEEL